MRVRWGSLFCTVIQTLSASYNDHGESKQEIVWATSQVRTAKTLLMKNFISGDPKNYSLSIFCPSTGKV